MSIIPKGITTETELRAWCALSLKRPFEPVPAKPLSEKMVEQSVAVVDGYVTLNFLSNKFSARSPRLTISLPAITGSEANESKWQRKMKRKLSAKEAVRKTLGPHLAKLTLFAEAYHAGKALRIVFTRLGGRRLDKGNVAMSMKVVEDMLEGALLANDGDPRWRSSYEQVPGGAIGVRVEIEVFG